MHEEPVSFESNGLRLRGILHDADSKIAVIFLHGWSGCRLGPHRMFVKAARQLSARGFPCLRFDFAGRGESDGTSGATTIATMVQDAGAAMDFMEQRMNISRFILLGLCSGAKVAIGRAVTDMRVKGLVLWSAEPMGELADGMRKTRKSIFMLGEYLTKLRNLETWRKILSGRVHVNMVKKAVISREEASPAEREAESGILRQFRSYHGQVQFVYGDHDPETRSAAVGYEQLCHDSNIPHEIHRIEGANHSFYSLAWEKWVIDLTADWLERNTESA